MALWLYIVRQRIARVNASLAFRSALRGIDPGDPLPNPGHLPTRHHVEAHCESLAYGRRSDSDLPIDLHSVFLALTNCPTGLTASVTVTSGTVA